MYSERKGIFDWMPVRSIWVIMSADAPGTRAIYVGFQGHHETKTIQLFEESSGKLFRLVANFVAVCHTAQRARWLTIAT